MKVIQVCNFIYYITCTDSMPDIIKSSLFLLMKHHLQIKSYSLLCTLLKNIFVNSLYSHLIYRLYLHQVSYNSSENKNHISWKVSTSSAPRHISRTVSFPLITPAKKKEVFFFQIKCR